ncbi:hypothetical protein M3Y98_01065500 [Aphelenchoides besseyi]|nr:hypothetical protein M3Y98_01065500 [Aphelenchoides besseyi]
MVNSKTDKEMDALLEKYEVFEVNEQGKLRCTVTGHEMPFRLDDLKNYVKTPKFLRNYEMDRVLKEYGEYFDDVGKNLFGCKLTMRTVSKDGKALLNHVNGGKFKRALAKHLAEKKEEEDSGDAGIDLEELPEDGDSIGQATIEVVGDESPPAKKGGKKRPKTSGVRRNAVKKRKA